MTHITISEIGLHQALAVGQIPALEESIRRKTNRMFHAWREYKQYAAEIEEETNTLKTLKRIVDECGY